ncbi:iron ABC transporter permease, partial [Mesorhizobium sp. M00.F.Ca.ET.186.01.1.1]
MKKQLLLWGGASSLILLASAVVSISMGAASLPLSQVWLILLHQLPGMSDLVAVTWPDSSEQIVMKVRFPRVILAILVGA